MLFVALFYFSFNTIAQNPDFPETQYTIYLKNGKSISGVWLWNIDTFKVEYVLNKNLTDISTNEVSDITCSLFYILFNSINRYSKNEYDSIKNSKNETLRGIITKIDSNKNKITYIPYKLRKQVEVNYLGYKIKSFNGKILDSESINKMKITDVSKSNKRGKIDKNSEKYKKLNRTCGIALIIYIGAYFLVTFFL
ncbi:MAG: hypothetical protein IT243_07045 [Bacteroidia bacterium]|nr:hypothetical protein [Bacteroidia bacterium]